MTEAMRVSSTNACGNERCPHGGSTYRCARCELVVCYCSGDDEVAVCDDCWGELDAQHYPTWAMAAAYGNDDRTVEHQG